jgi:hypothetical protein
LMNDSDHNYFQWFATAIPPTVKTKGCVFVLQCSSQNQLIARLLPGVVSHFLAIDGPAVVHLRLPNWNLPHFFLPIQCIAIGRIVDFKYLIHPIGNRREWILVQSIHVSVESSF